MDIPSPEDGDNPATNPLTDLQLQAIYGDAGGPSWGSGPATTSSFGASICLGLVFALFATLGASPLGIAAAGLAPIAIWLLAVITRHLYRWRVRRHRLHEYKKRVRAYTKQTEKAAKQQAETAKKEVGPVVVPVAPAPSRADDAGARIVEAMKSQLGATPYFEGEGKGVHKGRAGINGPAGGPMPGTPGWGYFGSHTRVIWDPKNPDNGGWDCSLLVAWACEVAEVPVAHVRYDNGGVFSDALAAAMWAQPAAPRVVGGLMSGAIDYKILKQGDLLFFGDPNGKLPGVHHVGVYVGGTNMISALAHLRKGDDAAHPEFGNVRETKLEHSYWPAVYVGALRPADLATVGGRSTEAGL